MTPHLTSRRYRAAALAVAAAIALLAMGCDSGEPARVEGLARVKVGGLTVNAEVPTGDAVYKGLGDRDSLARDRGMLFVFPETGFHAIWMKDMRFAIDIIWISDDYRVVHIEAGVPPPAAGTPDQALEIYRPSEAARFVLEVNAGLAAAEGVRVGDPAAIELP